MADYTKKQALPLPAPTALDEAADLSSFSNPFEFSGQPIIRGLRALNKFLPSGPGTFGVPDVPTGQQTEALKTWLPQPVVAAPNQTFQPIPQELPQPQISQLQPQPVRISPQPITGISQGQRDANAVIGGMRGVADVQAQGLENQAYRAGQAGVLTGDAAARTEQYQQQLIEVEKQKQAQRKQSEIRMAELERDFQGTQIKSYWADKNTGQKIGLALAAGLGAFGAALARSPNYAQQIIDNAVAMDLNQQQMNIAKKRQTLENARGTYALARQKFQDDQSAMLAAHVTSLKAIDTQIDEIKANATSDDMKTRADEIQAQNRLKEAMYIQALHDRQAQVGVEQNRELQQKYEQAIRQEGARRGLVSWDTVYNEKDPAFKDANKRVVAIDGNTYLAGGAEEARSAREQIKSIQEGNEAIAKIAAFKASGKNWTEFSPTERREADTIAAQVRIGLKTAWQLGVLSEQEHKLLAAVVPDPTALFTPGAEGAYKALHDANIRGKNSLRKSMQYQVVDKPMPGIGNTETELGTR
jgi:hypothetical protein